MGGIGVYGVLDTEAFEWRAAGSEQKMRKM